MPRHHRHHRRIHTIASSHPESTNRNEAPAIQTLDLSLGAIRQDLQKTFLITFVFVVGLILISTLNSHYHWTRGWGTTLYHMLHIR